MASPGSAGDSQSRVTPTINSLSPQSVMDDRYRAAERDIHILIVLKKSQELRQKIQELVPILLDTCDEIEVLSKTYPCNIGQIEGNVTELKKQLAQELKGPEKPQALQITQAEDNDPWIRTFRAFLILGTTQAILGYGIGYAAGINFQWYHLIDLTIVIMVSYAIGLTTFGF
ncbi:hypothetical protein F4781DRAFT_390160 [Annulohypoxylon bovei var. microspora]|nr:hypothetical protein F4781DRAFT_390160 [Annulohypoxylon bovei var. microspora]